MTRWQKVALAAIYTLFVDSGCVCGAIAKMEKTHCIISFHAFFQNTRFLVEFIGLSFTAAICAVSWININQTKTFCGSPRVAGLLLWLFSSPRTRDAKLDDLNECFSLNKDKHGFWTAYSLYWFDALRSVGPTILDLGFRIAHGVMKMLSS